jgi:hypothetical protein
MGASPEGTAGRFFGPCGTCDGCAPAPSAEALGYFRSRRGFRQKAALLLKWHALPRRRYAPICGGHAGRARFTVNGMKRVRRLDDGCDGLSPIRNSQKGTWLTKTFTTMVDNHKCDRWTGYASLVCVTFLIVVPLVIDFRDRDVAGLAFGIFFGVFGLYFAIRGLRLGSLQNRICAGVALIFYAWTACEIIVAILGASSR